MTQDALFDEGPFAPCPETFNMAAHTFAPALRAPERTALEVLRAPGEVAEHWTHGALRETVRRDAVVGHIGEAEYVIADSFTTPDPSPLVERVRGAIAGTPAVVKAPPASTA